eukprot:12962317-Alexandrium_andersonii.AAC.1
MRSTGRPVPLRIYGNSEQVPLPGKTMPPTRRSLIPLPRTRSTGHPVTLANGPCCCGLAQACLLYTSDAADDM